MTNKKNSTTDSRIFFNAIMTFIMIFFAGHGKQYIIDAVKRVPVLAVGGLVYSVLALVDSIVRSRFPKVKLFSVVSLASVYFSVGCLAYVIFEENVYCFGIFVGIVVGVVIYAFYPSTKRPKSDSRLKLVMVRLKVKGDRRFDVLHLATLIGILLKSGDPKTDELFKIVLFASEEVLNIRVDEPGGFILPNQREEKDKKKN